MTWILAFLFGNWMFLMPALGLLAIAIFLKDIKLIVVASAVLLLAGYIGTLKAELAVAEKGRDAAQTQAAAYKVSVEQQNIAVEGWKAAALQNAAVVKKSEAKARELASRIPAATQVIMDAKIPSKSDEPTCEESIQWLIAPEQLQSLHW